MNNLMYVFDCMLSGGNIGGIVIIVCLLFFALYCFASAFGKAAKNSPIVTVFGLLFAFVLFYMNYTGM